MVGRGFGVVMAYSFCCAPLHAVRHFAQPPQGAGMFRNRQAVSWPACSGSLVRRILDVVFIADSIRWLSTMEVSSRWKRPANQGCTPGNAYATAAAGRGSAAVFSGHSTLKAAP